MLRAAPAAAAAAAAAASRHPGHLPAICALIRARGFNVIAERSVRLDDSLAAALYEQHKGKDFYQRYLTLSRNVFL